MQTHEPHFIDVAQLQVGIYVHLDLGWLDHPFKLSNFKLMNEAQIEQIKNIGVKKLRYDPSRSDCTPLPITDTSPTPTPVASPTNASNTKAINPKVARLAQLQQAIAETEQAFVAASETAQQVTSNLLSAPQKSIQQATSLINEMTDTALMEADVAIHAINGNSSSDSNYQHSLNVTVLALMMARSIEMPKEDVRLLGLAAIFHDIGKAEIASNILNKKDTLTISEQMHYEQHSQIGARMAKEVGLPTRVAKIILHHHEHSDGTGYPARLSSNDIDPLARLVALANAYDNLCNPMNLALARTPYETLAYMYSHQRSKYDESLLKHLIKELGIYPPGSIVQLSTGLYGIVVSSNPSKPLRPYVMVHDTFVNRQNPRIIDLREEPKINIISCIRARQLPSETLAYLNPRNKVSYFINANMLTDGEEDV